MTFSARFMRSRTLWIGLALALSYWAVAPFVTSNSQAEWIRVAMIVFAGGAIVAWFPAFVTIIRENSPVAAQQSILGTVFLLVGIFGSAIWLLMWRMSGFPPWMVLSDVNGWFLWILCLGAVFLMAAPRVSAHDPPRTNWRRIWLAGAISLGLGYFIVHERPNIAPLVEWLRLRVSDVTGSPHHSGLPKWLEQTARASVGEP
ncbi:hypothetical protein C0214_19735 [Methylobacterium sp. DM1]|nr:hypothetical protein C0214_19735 [Methylobacterium sp. DM1]